MKGDFSRQTFDRTKHYDSVLMQQGRVQLDADWNEQQAIHQHRVETEAQDVIGLSGAPLNHAGFEIKLTASKLTIGAGRYYLDGLLCENETDVPYDEQPDLPHAPGVLEALKAKDTHTAIVYLDVWKRHVTALDDPTIVESALGGPDTTTRVKTIWQVKVLPVKEPDSGVVGCGSFFQEWDELVAFSTGALQAQSQPAAATSNPCILPSTAGYRGLENQLYRIEIHRGGTLGSDPRPTFKWSRDNGTVVTKIERINGQEVTVRDLGPDEVLSFASGQWVEITDDAAELGGRPGQLLQIDSVNRVSRVIKFATPPDVLGSGESGIEPKYHPKLRRWDSVSELPVHVPTTDDGFMTLENGIQIKFDGPRDRPVTYRTGDYWLIPARTVTNGESGSFKWSAARRAAGIEHHYSRLAVLRSDAEHKNVVVMQDCRKFFSPLTIEPALHVIGINWQNDDIVPLDRFRNEGLVVTLDGIPIQQTIEAPKVPQSINPATFIVSVESSTAVAADSTVTTPSIEVILNGIITVQHDLLSWKPATDEFTKLLVGPPLQRLVRVRLKGSVIWTLDATGQSRFLDGQAFGRFGLRASEGSPRTDLLLPSGCGARASDFESWFFLEAQAPPPPDLESFTLTPSTVRAGNPVTATITLTGPAPKQPMPITLTVTTITGRDGVSPLPGSVSVPEGQRTHTFTIQTAVDLVGVLSIKSTLRETEKTATLTTQMVSVTIHPKVTTVFGGDRVQFTAQVQGSLENRGVVFTVEGGVNAGAIVQLSATTAIYTPPPVTSGTFRVVATSVDDRTKSDTATVTVEARIKPRPEGPVVDNKMIRDAVTGVKPKVIRDAGTTKFTDVGPIRIGGIGVPPSRGGKGSPTKEKQQGKAEVKRKPASSKGAAKGRAFIRPEERPPVGEPKGKIKKSAKKRSRPKGKK